MSGSDELSDVSAESDAPMSESPVLMDEEEPESEHYSEDGMEDEEMEASSVSTDNSGIEPETQSDQDNEDNNDSYSVNSLRSSIFDREIPNERSFDHDSDDSDNWFTDNSENSSINPHPEMLVPLDSVSDSEEEPEDSDTEEEPENRSPIPLEFSNNTENNNSQQNETLTAKESGESVIRCPICRNNLKHRDPYAFVCGHISCKACVTELINNYSKKCPVCRIKFHNKDLRRLYTS